MKTKLFLGLFMLAAMLPVYADGDKGHGGDPCEARFREITKNLSEWIDGNGGEKLKLPSNISHDDFKSKMLDIINPYLDLSVSNKIAMECNDKAVTVKGLEKTCGWSTPEEDNSITDGRIHITCNRTKFFRENQDKKEIYEPEQYRNVIQEWLEIAGIAKTGNGSADYSVRDQITAVAGKWVLNYQLVISIESIDESLENSLDSVISRLDGMIYTRKNFYKSRACYGVSVVNNEIDEVKELISMVGNSSVKDIYALYRLPHWQHALQGYCTHSKNFECLAKNCKDNYESYNTYIRLLRRDMRMLKETNIGMSDL